MNKTTSNEDKPSLPPQPPRLFREHIVPTLPPYTGKYSVSCMEIELAVRQPRAFPQVERHGKPALRLDTVLFCVYYPCDLRTGDQVAESRLPWLPRPRVQTCKGYAKFFNVPNLPVTTFLASTSMFTKMPAVRNAPLAQKHTVGCAESNVHGSSGTRQGDREGCPFPVVIFSHGLGGSRTVCSAVCGELASSGFVVIAPEHRDGSCARTYVNVARPTASPSAPPDPGESGVDPGSRKVQKQRARNYYVVDYLFPEGNPRDTAPNNDRGVDMELRSAQIDMRLEEIEEVIYILQVINDGGGDNIAGRNLRRKGNVGSSSHGLDGIDWATWRGRMNLQDITMMGHSFGGATTVQVLRRDIQFPCIGRGILLDAWGVAIPQRKQDTAQRYKPLLAIGSEAFMYWEDNFTTLQKICREARDGNQPVWMLTLRGSAHLSQTDFALLYPRLLSIVMKTTVNSRRGVYMTVGLCLEFLKLVLPPQEVEFGSPWVGSTLSDADSGGGITLEHRPKKKWVAARLKIPKEPCVRLRTWVTRKKERDKSKRKLVGLQEAMEGDDGDKVWIHLAPKSAVREKLQKSTN